MSNNINPFLKLPLQVQLSRKSKVFIGNICQQNMDTKRIYDKKNNDLRKIYRIFKPKTNGDGTQRIKAHDELNNLIRNKNTVESGSIIFQGSGENK
jgi:hypothetical protein